MYGSPCNICQQLNIYKDSLWTSSTQEYIRTKTVVYIACNHDSPIYKVYKTT